MRVRGVGRAMVVSCGRIHPARRTALPRLPARDRPAHDASDLQRIGVIQGGCRPMSRSLRLMSRSSSSSRPSCWRSWWAAQGHLVQGPDPAGRRASAVALDLRADIPRGVSAADAYWLATSLARLAFGLRDRSITCLARSTVCLGKRRPCGWRGPRSRGGGIPLRVCVFAGCAGRVHGIARLGQEDLDYLVQRHASRSRHFSDDLLVSSFAQHVAAMFFDLGVALLGNQEADDEQPSSRRTRRSRIAAECVGAALLISGFRNSVSGT